MPLALNEDRCEFQGTRDTMVAEMPEMPRYLFALPAAPSRVDSDQPRKVVEPLLHTKLVKRDFGERPRNTARPILRAAITVGVRALIDLDFHLDFAIEEGRHRVREKSIPDNPVSVGKIPQAAVQAGGKETLRNRIDSIENRQKIGKIGIAHDQN